MTNQLKRIQESSEYLRNKIPKKFTPEIALITEKDFDLPKDFKVLSEIKFEKIPPDFENAPKNPGSIQFAKVGDKDVIIFRGRFHYYDGVNMRDIGHTIYVLKNLGIKKIISIDEVSQLNPRYKTGELVLIYDHINLIGDNPLIGKNDDTLGLRFPDMSNAYDKDLFKTIVDVFRKNILKINESVYLGITGPSSETDAEARFYRESGAEVLGYSIVPENIAAVHAGMKYAAIGLLTRELVADKMIEDGRSDKQKSKDRKENLKQSGKVLSKILPSIIKRI